MSCSQMSKNHCLDQGRPDHIPKAPDNPEERTLLLIRQDQTDFEDIMAVNFISQLCLENWPTSAVTWASTPAAHKAVVWQEFKRRYKWAETDAAAIETLFWQKCLIYTEDNLKKELNKALHNAGIDHLGQAEEYVHEYNPWWCSKDIWEGMCILWKADETIEMYKGDDAWDYDVARAAHSIDPMNWLDMYLVTRPDDVHIAGTYKLLMDERYPPGNERPDIDWDLWKKLFSLKRLCVRDQGQHQQLNDDDSCSSESDQSTQSTVELDPKSMAADFVAALGRDPLLLRLLADRLNAFGLDLSAGTSATKKRQQEGQTQETTGKRKQKMQKQETTEKRKQNVQKQENEEGKSDDAA